MHPLKFLKKKFGFAIASLLIAIVGFVTVPALTQPAASAEPPAVEYLTFQVPTDQRARFIEQDAAIWTPVLSSYPGFQSKEIWTTSTNPDQLVLVIHWSSFAQWQAIPKDVLDRTTQQFHQAMEAEYLPEVTAFQVAWRSSSNP